MCSRRPSEDDDRPKRLQYSLRTLLLLMTLCCVALSVLRNVSVPLWVLPLLGILAWSALVVAYGRAALVTATSYRERRAEHLPGPSARRRWAVLFATLGAFGPVITFLLFVAVFSFAGLDVERLGMARLAVNEFTGTNALNTRGAWAIAWLALTYANLVSILLNVASYSVYWRSRTDMGLFALRLFGLMSSSVATCAALVCLLNS